MAKKSTKKVAMVAPVPAKPARVFTLEECLELLGNDRAYTLIRSHGNSWKVHFNGDATPTFIKLVNGKVVTSKEDD